MGKSASGKDTILKQLLQRLPEYRTIILYTTRPIRSGETNTIEYYFVEEEVLHALQEEQRVIELRSYQTIAGMWHYFTVDDEQIDLERFNYIVIGTLESFQAMRRYFGEEIVEPIYIEMEDGLRLKRAIAREESQEYPRYEEMCRRFLADQQDFSEENLQEAGIVLRFRNINSTECVEQIMKYITSKS